jgi:hypothetical protein
MGDLLEDRGLGEQRRDEAEGDQGKGMAHLLMIAGR